MRILIANTWYYPNMMGGAEHSVKILAENLVKNGHEVAVFCIDNKEPKIIKEKINGVIIYRSNSCKYRLYEAYAHSLNIFSRIYNKYLEVYNTSINNNFLQVIEEFKPDVVHGNCLAGISLSIVGVLNKKNIPMIQTMRDYWMLSPKAIFKENNNILLELALSLYRRYCINRSSQIFAVTAPSKFTLNTFLNKGFFKNALFKYSIANCVDSNKEYVNEIIHIKKEKKDIDIKFLYVGWISEIKGIRNLISAFKNSNNTNISLVMCGDGELKEFLLKEIEEDLRIKYMGKLASDELMEVYKSCDVLIIPSLWEEPFGRVVIEANMNGLPVIASDRGGIPEIIDTMKSGIVYSAESQEELERCIEKMSDRSYIKSFYNNIVNNIDQYFADKQIESYEELYKKVILKYK